LNYLWFLSLFLLFLLFSVITLVSLFDMRLYVPVRAVVSDCLNHRLDLAVQFLAVFAPEVGFCRVYNEFHVLTVSLQDRMVRENTQLLVVGFRGYLLVELFHFVCLLFLKDLLEIYRGLRSKRLT